MLSRHIDELGKALAKPHGNVSFHVDSKGFKSLLQATDGKVTKTADVLTQVDPADLRKAQTAHRYEAWGWLTQVRACIRKNPPHIMISSIFTWELLLISVVAILTLSYLDILKGHLRA